MLKVMTYINRLLKKFREGNFSDKELTDLTTLLKIPTYDEATDASMFMHWKDCDNSPIGDEQRFIQILDEIHHTINVKSKKTTLVHRFYIGFSKVAAILIIPLMVAFYMIGLNQNPKNLAVQQNTITVPLGATSNFTLPDGTNVMLNSGSTLTYPLSFERNKNRLVALNGEGYFKVSKNKRKPFIVNMNGIDIKVTGTAFNARAYNDESNVIVALVEGSVLFGNQLPENKFETKSELKPMDVAILDKTNKKIEKFRSNDLKKHIAWTQGITMFDNDPIQTVTDKLEKLYNVEVIINDKELLNYRLTATFTNEPLERALKIISMSSPISYHIISGNKDSLGIYGQRTLIMKRKR